MGPAESWSVTGGFKGASINHVTPKSRLPPPWRFRDASFTFSTYKSKCVLAYINLWLFTNNQLSFLYWIIEPSCPVEIHTPLVGWLQKFWKLEVVFFSLAGSWKLEVEFWKLGFGLRKLEVDFSDLEVGTWVLEVGSWVLEVWVTWGLDLRWQLRHLCNLLILLWLVVLAMSEGLVPYLDLSKMSAQMCNSTYKVLISKSNFQIRNSKNPNRKFQLPKISRKMIGWLPQKILEVGIWKLEVGDFGSWDINFHRDVKLYI